MDVPFIYLFISPPPNLLSYFFCPKETKEFSLEKQLGASSTFARFPFPWKIVQVFNTRLGKYE